MKEEAEKVGLKVQKERKGRNSFLKVKPSRVKKCPF
jgi:hypothetical protein